MNDVLVVAESRQGSLAAINGELVTAGVELATSDDDVHLAVAGGEAIELAGELTFGGVDMVHAVEYPDGFNNEVHTAAVVGLFRELQPRALVLPHTVSGMDYAPAVASELDLPILTKMTGVERGEPLQVARKAYNSKVDVTVAVDGEPVVFTVWGDEFEPADADGDPEVVEHEFDAGAIDRRSRLVTVTEAADDDVDITTEDFILAIGRGVEEEENLDVVGRACEALGATLAGSRPLIELGWLPKERQVGQSGKVVTPKVYVAIGISGAVEHLAGMKGSETIIAINTDESAPIFDVADYGIVADLFDVVPALVDEVS